jgi:CRP-like cAMP-binding protein
MGVSQSPSTGRSALNHAGQNHLLSLLPLAERERIFERGHKRALKLRQVLHAAHGPVTHAHFPLSGMVSLVAKSDEDNAIVEVGVVGNEGLVGMPLFLGTESTPTEAICQVAGEVLSLPAAVFEQELEASRTLRPLLQRYTQALMSQVAQSVVCNSAHRMEQRMCRWLLITHDRVGADEMQLTHEFLSQMLGARRPSVTITAGILKKAGLIDYSRGKIVVLNRAGLEAGACDCYRVVKREFERLLVVSIRRLPPGGRTADCAKGSLGA